MSEVYDFIKKADDEFPVAILCEVLRVSRSAYYAWRQGKTHRLSDRKIQISQAVKTVFEKHLQRYGSRRIEAELKESGMAAGRYQIRSRMQEQGLKAIQPRSFVPKTTQTNPNLLRSPNLLLQIECVRINQVWVGDITYLPMADGTWTYLAIWMDLHSRFIVGWQVSRSLDASLVIRSFEKALQRRRPPPGLVVHSDGGGQYMDADFRKLLATNRCLQSMTRVDNHYDNAFAESLFSRFKTELLRNGTFLDLDDAHTKIFEYMEAYYNRIRRHSALKYKSPQNFELEIAF